MASTKDILWSIEPHTKAKHEILRNYLGAWFGIMSPKNLRIIYLDGFCGPGRYKGGEIGSPLIALKSAIDHSARKRFNEIKFIFIEKDEDRLLHLEKEIKSLDIPSNFQIESHKNQFDDTLKKILDDLGANGQKLAPTFAFIDPFGFKGISFSIIQSLLSNDRTEIFINFMADPINRFFNHPISQIGQHITELFGTPEVIKLIEKDDGGSRINKLRLLYQKQLLKIAKFVRYFEMRDDRGRLIYYLFFASNNRLGHIKMKEAFWKMDCYGGCRFSDATDPNQMILFKEDPSEKLSEEIFMKNCRQRKSVEQIKIEIEDETVYINKHVKQALKNLEQRKMINVEDLKLDGMKRRKNSFPDNAIVIFT